MKKSLPVLVSAALVSSISASVAFAAAELTTGDKLNILIEAGIFDRDGTGNGSELESSMTREQLAKIIAKLKNLKEIPGTGYTDVAADRWSASFIQAVSKAAPPLMNGVAEERFDPSGEVTLEQMAAVVVRALDLQAGKAAPVKGYASDWAKDYVAAAFESGLLGEEVDYTKPATRSELVEAAYGAKQALDNAAKPAKASIQSVKAAGSRTVEVALDRDVDTGKAILTLTKGGDPVAADTKWSDDKTTAVLTLKQSKVSEGEYTVTLGGLDASQIATASKRFVGENEVVKKLEFVLAADTIAKSKKAIAPFRALNQYGENASVSPADFTVTTPNFASTVKKDGNGMLFVSMDTSAALDGSAVFPNTTVVPIYLVENDSRLSIGHTFKLGSEPFIQKLELGDVKYTSDKKELTAMGETATIPVAMYDQYGNPVGYDSKNPGDWVTNMFTTPYLDRLKGEFGDFDNDNFGEWKLSLTGRVEKSEELDVRVQIEGASASAKVKAGSARLVTKIEFGTPSGSLNEAEEKDVFIPIVGYDESGKPLTADELVEDENYNKINVTASHVIGTGKDGKVTILKHGPYKGQLHITGVKEGVKAGSSAIFGAYLTSSAGNNSYVTIHIPIERIRVPDKIGVATANAPKTAGGSAGFKLVVYDQNGKQLDKLPAVTENGRTVTYDVYVEYKGTNGAHGEGDNQLKITRNDRFGYATSDVYTAGSAPTIYAGSDVQFFNNTFSFGVTSTAAGAGSGEKLEYKASLRKTVEGGSPTVISTAARSIAYIDGAAADLTYTVSKPTAMYGIKDSVVLTSDQMTLDAGIMRKAISVSAKDSAGDTVVLPNSGIVSVTSSVYSVAQAKSSSSAGGTGYVLGYTPGKAPLNVAYRTLNGELRMANVEAEVKEDTPVISRMTSIAMDTIRSTDLFNKAVFNKAWQFMRLTLVDQYGVSYGTTNINAYAKITGVMYVLEVDDPADEGLIAVSNDGETKGDITFASELAPGTHYFTVTAYANGKSASTYIRYIK